MDQVQANATATQPEHPDEYVLALVRWRLADPAWVPSFDNLLDDIRSCIDMQAGPPLVLSSLMAVLKLHPELAPRARLLAEEARGTMAARIRNRKSANSSFAQRILNSFRQAAGRA
jgi:hypothetical protein